jgi:hypothetical protein
MNLQIKAMLEASETCLQELPLRAVEQFIKPKANMVEICPVEEIGINFFHYCSWENLLLVDRCSGYPMTVEMRTTMTAATTKHLNSWFHSFRFPSKI